MKIDNVADLILPEGPHKVEIAPVNANHQPLDRSVVVEFVIPGRKATK